MLYTAKSTVSTDTSAFLRVGFFRFIYKSEFPVNIPLDVCIAIALRSNFLWTSNIDVLPVRNILNTVLKIQNGFLSCNSATA